VLDEGRTLKGREAIKAWNLATRQNTVTWWSRSRSTRRRARHCQRPRIRQFSGSPIVLPFSFQLAGDQIAHLEIADGTALDGRRALVTAGTKGIGAAVAVRLA
jgi:hypothetical protein